MAYVVGRPDERWDLRESDSTRRAPKPHARELQGADPQDPEHARDRSSKPLEMSDPQRRQACWVLRSSPATWTVPLGNCWPRSRPGGRPAVRFAASWSTRSSQARQGRPTSARGAARWAASTPAQRGETLRDLLELADRLPPARRSGQQRFPRIDSRPA